MAFRIASQKLALDAGRDLLPFRLGLLPPRRWHWLLARLLGDAKRQTALQGRRGIAGNLPRLGFESLAHDADADLLVVVLDAAFASESVEVTGTVADKRINVFRKAQNCGC